MTILSLLATIFGTISGLANLPQVYKVFKRKSAKDISLTTYLIIFIGTLIWSLYGIEMNNFAVIITNGLGFISVGLVIVGWILYGQETKKKSKRK